VSELRTPVEVAGFQQLCRRLHMPTIVAQCAPLADQAIQDKQRHLIHLEMLLEAEMEEREQNVVGRRFNGRPLSQGETLEEFNFEVAPYLPVTRLRQLAEGQYIEKTEPLVFIGDTGKFGGAIGVDDRLLKKYFAGATFFCLLSRLFECERSWWPRESKCHAERTRTQTVLLRRSVC